MAEESNKASESGTPAQPGAAEPVATAPPKKPADVKKPAAGKGRAATIVDVLYNLILLGSIGFIGYLVYEQDKAVGALFDQQNAFAGQRNEAFSNYDARISELQSTIGELLSAVTAARQEAADLVADQAAEIGRLQNELVSTRLRISTSSLPSGSRLRSVGLNSAGPSTRKERPTPPSTGSDS